jgi:hypothetical protein
MPQALQGRGVQRDPLRGGGARPHLRAHGRHGRLPGQGPLVHGHQGRVSPVSCVATKEEVTKASCRTSGRTSCKKPAACKKRGGGTSGTGQALKNNGNPRAGKPHQTGKGTQQQQPRQQQQSNIAHQRAIEGLNLQLEVARVNGGGRLGRGRGRLGERGGQLGKGIDQPSKQCHRLGKRERRQGDATLHDTTTYTPPSDSYSPPPTH